ncbi:MAG: hypothetical protein K8T91_01655 [Planctomycetes bacterium]|nr:hypothetical protein [Planctomycetota bacterium]
MDTTTPAGITSDRKNIATVKSQTHAAAVSPPHNSIHESPWQSDDGISEEREGFVMLQKIIYGILVFALIAAAITNILVLKL